MKTKAPYWQLGFRRTRRTVNAADPTDMVRWNREPQRGLFRLRVTLTEMWDTELRVELLVGWHALVPAALRHRCFLLHRGYGTRLAAFLFGALERRYEAAEAARDDDPTGTLADYE